MRIENLWKQRLTWELLVLSLPAALLVAFIALTHTPARRINVSDRADRAMGAPTLADDQQSPTAPVAESVRAIGFRYQFRNRMAASPIVGLSSSANPEMDRFQSMLGPVLTQTAAPGVFPFARNRAFEWTQTLGLHLASACLGNQAVREAGDGKWQAAAESVRRANALNARKMVSALALQSYWGGVAGTAPVLLGMRPGGDDAKALARLAADEARSCTGGMFRSPSR